MWAIECIEIREVKLDFSSSSGRHPRTQAIFGDGICLVNALSFARLGDEPAQFVICEECGSVHCKPGGWINIRRIAQHVAFIPAFSNMLDGEFELSEYSPPEYVESRGVPILAGKAYEQVVSAVPAFPPITQLRSLTAEEAVCLVQWEAPLKVLGKFPNPPQLVRNAVLAVTDGDLDDQCDRLQQFLHVNAKSQCELSAVNSAGNMPVEFHLDADRFPSWRPVVRTGIGLAFNFEPADPVVPRLTISEEPIQDGLS